MKQGFHALILAAGKGTRFKSDTIKVLHPLMGRTMIDIVLDSVSRLRPDMIHLVVGYQKKLVQESLKSRNIDFVEQKTQLGTAHAVMAARPLLSLTCRFTVTRCILGCGAGGRGLARFNCSSHCTTRSSSDMALDLSSDWRSGASTREPAARSGCRGHAQGL